MSKTITATELARNLADYLNRVSYRGESFVVQRGGRPVAELRPAPRGVRGADVIARYRSLPHLTPAEATALGQEIENARAALESIAVENPWDS
jgi:prevent-host-death family protein